MKKKAMIAALILAGSMLGGGAAYLTMSPGVANAGERSETTAGTPGSAAGAHFTSYQQQSYPDLTYAAENAVPAVVNIEVTQEVVAQRGFDPFLEFFGIPQGYSQRDGIPQERKGGGSGVIITQDGYIVTNHHVVDKATKMKVKLYDGRIFEATLVGTDPTTEVALVKIDAKGLPTLPFGDSDALRLGEWVLAIGSPFDLQSTITAGIVSAKARNLGAISNQNSVESFIQTDAAVNPGNSGGALVNTAGELVGVNTLILTQNVSRTYMGYSFAIPSSIVRKVVGDLREYGVVQRAMLGISYRYIDQEFLDELDGLDGNYKITETGGVFVASTDPDGAAHAAGIREGDVITEIDGVKLDGKNNLSEIIARRRPNDKIKISVKSGGKMKQMEVVLRNKAGKAELLAADRTDVQEALGGRFAEIGEKAKKSLKIDHGIQVIEVQRGGILDRARIKRDFIITHINERPVRSVNDLDKMSDPVTYIEGVYPNGQRMGFSIVQ